MAIFHLNESNISRSDGRSAVACAAYRACEKLEDYTFGKTQDYTRKNGLEYKCIYAPEHTNENLLDRQTLWNTVEKKEFNANGSMKANARLAKEYTCALPYELTDQERIKIVDDFCRDFVKKHNVIVDACIHAPHEHNDETDNKNYHVHIMFTTRLINDKGELGKKQRTFNDNGPEILKDSRATFANVVNTALENAGLDERIDHRSYKDQGLDFLEATTHEGHEVTALRRQGIDTEISLKNDAVKAQNLEAAREYQQVIKGLDQEIFVPSRLEDQIAQLENELHLTAEEEKELLAELDNLNREEERLQEQKLEKIEKTYNDFIDLQSQYSEYAKYFYELGKIVNKELKVLDKKFKKSEKWLSNQTGIYILGGIFYDNYHHKQINVDTPDYFITDSSIDKEKQNLMKCYKQDIINLSQSFNIESTVQELHRNAQELTKNEIEIPVLKATFIQKIMCEYVHSYSTLDDFSSDMKPFLDDHKKEEEIKREKEVREYYEQLRRNEYYEQLNLEKNKRKAEHELEVKKRIEERKNQEMRWAKERSYEPSKPKNDNDNDYSAW